MDENFQNPLLYSNKNNYEYRKILSNQQNTLSQINKNKNMK